MPLRIFRNEILVQSSPGSTEMLPVCKCWSSLRTSRLVAYISREATWSQAALGTSFSYPEDLFYLFGITVNCSIQEQHMTRASCCWDTSSLHLSWSHWWHHWSIRLLHHVENATSSHVCFWELKRKSGRFFFFKLICSSTFPFKLPNKSRVWQQKGCLHGVREEKIDPGKKWIKIIMSYAFTLADSACYLWILKEHQMVWR